MQPTIRGLVSHRLQTLFLRGGRYTLRVWSEHPLTAWRASRASHSVLDMSLHALTRSILFLTSLLAALGQSVDALAHGIAHAHETEHRLAVSHFEPHAHQQQDQQREHDRHHQQDQQSEHDGHQQHDEQGPHPLTPQQNEASHHALELAQFEVTQPDHQHDHLHAIVDAALKSRADVVPFLAAQPPALALSVSAAIEHATPQAGRGAHPPERQHTSASPRAPPSR